MVVPYILRLAFVVLVLYGISCSGNGVAAQGCEGDLQALIKQCAQYVLIPGPKIPPSTACCGIIQKADIPCVCKYITKEVERIISVEKVVYVADYCGEPLPHGSKCGSYTIPKGAEGVKEIIK